MLNEPESLAPSHEASSLTSAARRYRFPLEFLTNITVSRAPDYLIKGLLPTRALAVLYGQPGSGKSFLALEAALHVAAGRPWAGCKVRGGGVVYVAAEAGRGMRKRIVAALRHHVFDPALPFALLTVAPDLGRREGDAEALAREILAQAPTGFNPQLIVLDTLARSMVGGDESGSAGMGQFVASAEQLGSMLGAAVLAVHHMGKDKDRGMRGSSALLGAVDAAWEIDPDDPRVVRVVKMKDDADRLCIPFTLSRVTLDTDTEGDLITTCVVSVGEARQRPAKAVDVDPSADDKENSSEARLQVPPREVFLAAFRAVVAEHGAVYTRSRHVPRDMSGR